MGQLAFVFAGQGSQFAGMGRDLLEKYQVVRDIFERADGIRPGTSAQCFDADAAELSRTVNTQPCMYTLEIAIARLLEEHGIIPGAVAGFSLGEAAALAAAGVFSFEEGLGYIMHRAKAMDEAAQASPGAMAAILGPGAEEVAGICSEIGNVWPVNYNCPGQTVVSGTPDAVGEAVSLAAQRGGRGIPLAVSGAFHSPFMKPAYDSLLAYLETVRLTEPWLPVYYNLTGDHAAGLPMPLRIASQVMSPVLWEKTVVSMKRDGFDRFVEIGPGKVLSGLIRKTFPEAAVMNVQDEASLSRTLAALGS